MILEVVDSDSTQMCVLSNKTELDQCFSQMCMCGTHKACAAPSVAEKGVKSGVYVSEDKVSVNM